MALLFMDGFDHYNNNQGSNVSFKWDTQVQTYSPGRWGGRCATSSIVKTIYPLGGSDITIGFAIKFVSSDGEWFSLWHDAVKVLQVELDPNTAEIILASPRSVSGNYQPIGTPILNTGAFLEFNLWYYIELHFDLSVGTFIMRVDNVEVPNMITFSLSSIFNKFKFRGNYQLDDLYVLNSTGARNNTFLGEIKIQSQVALAPGFRDDFGSAPPAPPPAEGNAHNVNNPIIEYIDWGIPLPHYNFSSILNNIDTYVMNSHDTRGQIFAIQNSTSVRKDNIGNRTVAVCARRHIKDLTGFVPSTSSQYGEKQGPTAACFETYKYLSQLLETDPETGNQWQLSNVNVTDVGVIIKG